MESKTTEYEQILQIPITDVKEEENARTKYVTVSRRISDSFLYLHLRNFRYCEKLKKFLPTKEGVSLNFIQTSDLIKTLKDFSFKGECVHPKNLTISLGAYNGLEYAWLNVPPNGKQVILMRMKGHAINGFQLLAEEMKDFMTALTCIDFVLHPKSVSHEDITFYAVAKEIRSHIGKLLYEKCEGCQWKHPSQRRHDCCMMDEKTAIMTYFDEAKEGVNKDNVNHLIEKYSIAAREEPTPYVNLKVILNNLHEELFSYLTSDEKHDIEILLCYLERK